jgi:hypothetical protein
MAEQQAAIVTIFPGPGDLFRVRALTPNCLPQTVKVTSFWNDAVEFIRDNYHEEQARSPEEFRAAYHQCRQHQ